MTHTPGPWAQSHRKGPDDMYRTQVYDAAGETIANIAWYPVHTSQTTTSTNREANARLIAAAPELLDALRELFADYKRLADSGDAGNWSLEDTTIGQQALAAIAKAEGQS
jgi:hypothetical protein